MGVRFIHTSDWQLGMTRHFLPAEEQGRYSEARLDAIREVVRLANDEACDFVVVAGDVFESNQSDRHSVARLFEILRPLRCPIVLVPGNHDPLTAAGSIWDASSFVTSCPPHVYVARDTTPLRLDGVDAEIVGVPWTTKHPTSDRIAETLAALEPNGTVRVLVGHGAVDALDPDRENLASISLERVEAPLPNAW